MAYRKNRLENAEDLIMKLDRYSSIPFVILFIVQIAYIIEAIYSPTSWANIIVIRLLGAIFGYIFYIYDRRTISEYIQKGEFSAVVTDCFLWGMLGCFMYGTGIILLIKGIAIYDYLYQYKLSLKSKPEKDEYSKNINADIFLSLNYSTSSLGFIIILMAFYNFGIEPFYQLMINNGASEAGVPYSLLNVEFVPFLIMCALLIISIIALFKDYDYRAEFTQRVKEFELSNEKFKREDFFRYLFIGIFACFYFGAGIFILIKSLVIFFYSDLTKI